jgi:hypothetical protein
MRRAEQIIGDQAPDDYILQPEAHADQLPREAGALARLLCSEPFQAIIQEYRSADDRALRFQWWYKRLGATAIALQAFAAIAGAIFLVVRFNYYPLIVGQSVSMIELAALALAVSAGGIVAWADLFKKWNEARAAAEIKRIEFFEQLASASTPVAIGELPLLPLQLEYFRRYQLQIQKAYYRQRGADHLFAHRLQQAVGGVLAIMTIFLLFVAANGPLNLGWDFGVIGEWLTERNEHNAFIGLVLITISVAAVNWSLISQDENNARRYAATLANLEKAEADYLASARDAAEAGNKEGVLGFVDWVNQFVSLEHRQWIVLQDIASRPDLGPFGVFRRPKLKDPQPKRSDQ